MITVAATELFDTPSGSAENYVDLYKEVDASVALISARLDSLAAAGVQRVVDLRTVGTGRDIALLSRASAGHDVEIVTATGLPARERLLGSLRIDDSGHRLGHSARLVEWFVHDLTEGIARTGSPARLISCAVEATVRTDDVAVVLRAVGAAHQITGAPVLLRIATPTAWSADLLDLLGDDVAPHTVLVSLEGAAGDEQTAADVLAAGPRLVLDRVEVLAALVRSGFADRMMVSVAGPTSGRIDRALLDAGVPSTHVDMLLDANPALFIGLAEQADPTTIGVSG